MLHDFPRLKPNNWKATSEETPSYNCIAYAAGDTTRWWEPDTGAIYYWPDNAPREYTIEAYLEAFRGLGYEDCSHGRLKRNYEKVALFALEGIPTHAARQTSSGIWLSKLGKNIDITHDLEAVGGGLYGEPVAFLQRPRLADV